MGDRKIGAAAVHNDPVPAEASTFDFEQTGYMSRIEEICQQVLAEVENASLRLHCSHCNSSYEVPLKNPNHAHGLECPCQSGASFPKST